MSNEFPLFQIIAEEAAYTLQFLAAFFMRPACTWTESRQAREQRVKRQPAPACHIKNTIQESHRILVAAPGTWQQIRSATYSVERLAPKALPKRAEGSWLSMLSYLLYDAPGV